MTISYINVEKAPVQVPVIDLLQEPQGAAFDFISGKAWIVDKVNPANTMLRNIGDVLTNPGASATKLLRRKSGLLESAPWWANEYDLAGNPMGMRVEAQRVRLSRYPLALDNAAWLKSGCVATPTGQAGVLGGSSFKLAATVGRARILQSGSSGSATIWCGWAIVEAAEWQYATIGRGNGAGLWTCLTFDLLTGQMVNRTDASTPPTLVEWGSISLGNGKWLIFMRTNEVGGTFYVAPAYNASGYLFANSAWPFDGVAGIIVHGIEVEDGAFPTSPILAGEAAAATRAADQPQIPVGFLPFNMAAGTMIWKGMAFDYDSGAQGLGQPSMRLYRTNVHYAQIGKSDTAARNSRAYYGVRNTSAPSIEDAQDFSFPVSPAPAILAMSWDEQSVIGVSGKTGTVVETAAGPGSVIDPLRLLFDTANGIAWHQFGILIPRKLSGPALLQRTRP